MEIVKKNILSIVCGVVALLAIIALFWPIGGLYEGLGRLLDSSMSTGTRMQQLTTKTRTMPLLSPDETDPAALTVYPTETVIAAGVHATQQVNLQSLAMMKAAVEANRHFPLLSGSLPKPDETSKYNFAQKYVEQTTLDARWRSNQYIPDLDLNAGKRPTAQEITDKQKEDHDKYIQNNSIPNDQQSIAQAEEQYSPKAGLVKPDLLLDRAKNISVYLEPGAFTYDSTIGIGAGHILPDGDKIWDAQLNLWILDDITRAVARTNKQYSDPAGAGEVPDSVLRTPIKQIEKIDTPVTVNPGPSDLAAGANNTAVIKEPTVSLSGHTSNGLYDVVRFGVVLKADASKVAIVLRELQVGQFITVLNVQMTNVDPATAISDGFIFGDKPVVRLDLQCEELLLHDWTNDLQPDTRNFSKGYKGSTGSVGVPTIGFPPNMPGGPDSNN